MERIIESTLVCLEPTLAEPDYLVDPKEYLTNSLKDFIQVPVEEGKHTILVSKYRLGINEEVKKAVELFNSNLEGRVKLNLDFTSEEISSGRNYLTNIYYSQAIDLNRTLGNFTLSPKYFLNFLQVLKSGEALDGNNKSISKAELLDTYNEIMQIREPLRGEFIDIKFRKIDEVLYASYPKVSSKGFGIVTMAVPEETLLKNPNPDVVDFTTHMHIDSNELLSNSTFQGLPKKGIVKGNLFYDPPYDGCIIHSFASPSIIGFSKESILSSNNWCGVRAARLLK